MTIKTYQKFNEGNVHEGLSIYFQSIGDEFGLEVEDRSYTGSESVRIKFKNLNQYINIEEDFRTAFEHLESEHKVGQIIYEFIDIDGTPTLRTSGLPSIENLEKADRQFFEQYGTYVEDGELYYCLYVTINTISKKP